MLSLTQNESRLKISQRESEIQFSNLLDTLRKRTVRARKVDETNYERKYILLFGSVPLL